jgi:anti-sigma regulatory factor (Ser/Thr protein kinase)
LRESEERFRNIVLQQRKFLKDILRSVTEGKLLLCDDRDELPTRLSTEISAIPLSAEKLWQLRKVTEAAALANSLSECRANDLVTAASEAGMNAVVHAGGGEARIHTASGQVQVWVEDAGRGIDLSSLPQATLERGYTTAGSLGHGFFMMLNFADRIYLLTGPDGTTVVLEQYQTPPEPAWMQLQGFE